MNPEGRDRPKERFVPRELDETRAMELDSFEPIQKRRTGKKERNSYIPPRKRQILYVPPTAELVVESTDFGRKIVIVDYAGTEKDIKEELEKQKQRRKFT